MTGGERILTELETKGGGSRGNDAAMVGGRDTYFTLGWMLSLPE
jgi:hypothetical protein